METKSKRRIIVEENNKTTLKKIKEREERETLKHLLK